MRKSLASIITVVLASACGPGAGASAGISGDASPTMSGDAGRTFEMGFPARADRPAMPARLVDRSGTIVGVAPAPDAMEDIDWGFVAIPGKPKVVAMGWVSSGCDTSATVTFEIRQGTGWWVVETEPGPAACPFEYRGRTMLVSFSAPPDQSSFQFDMESMGMVEGLDD